MGLIRSGNTKLTPKDDDKLTEYLWPIVREMIKTAIENQQNLIVEGCYIPYEWRKEFDAAYLFNIRFICLSMSENYISSHFAEIINHGRDVEKRIDDSDCTKEWLTEENGRIMNGFRQAGEQVVLIDDDYESAIRRLI